MFRCLEENPEMLVKAQHFAKCLCNHPDVVLECVQKISDVEAQIAWILFGTAISQGLNDFELQMVLSGMMEAFPGDALWALPVPSKEFLQQVVYKAMPKMRSSVWDLESFVPGIFWSVGLFTRRRFPLTEWVSKRTTRELWRDLGEIYFMGKAARRPKVCAALFRLLAPPPVGLHLKSIASVKELPFPVSAGGARFLAFHILASGRGKQVKFSDLPPIQKQNLANTFYKKISSASPLLAAHAFHFFLENGQSGFICKEETENCATCPLKNDCRYAEC